MTFKEILAAMGRKRKEKKELFRHAEEEEMVYHKLGERKKSANERELARFLQKEREDMIKEELDLRRKMEQHDITFNHNPLNVKNITNHTDWEVLKEKNMFKNNGNLFTNQEFIHKNNPNMFRDNMGLLR